MKNVLKNLTQQLAKHGVVPDQIKQEGKTAITMAYLDTASQNAVSGGLVLGSENLNFWQGPVNFCKVIS